MKPTLLLLHGALGSKRYLQPLKEALKEQFKVYDLDFEGHGEYASNAPFSIERFVQNTLDFITNNELKNVHMFGYSMGGYVALTLANQHSNLITSITTLGTKFNWSPEIAQQEVRMLNPEKIEEKVPAFAEQLNKLHPSNDWKTVMRNTAELMLGLGNGKGLKDSELTSLNTKVTIGIGTADKMVSIEESQQVAECLTNGKLVKLNGIGHPIERIPIEVLKNYVLDSISL